MVILQGGCDNCGRLMESRSFDPNIDETPKLICNDCYERFYSPQAIRERKLNQVLDKSVWSKLKSLFKK